MEINSLTINLLFINGWTELQGLIGIRWNSLLKVTPCQDRIPMKNCFHGFHFFARKPEIEFIGDSHEDTRS